MTSHDGHYVLCCYSSNLKKVGSIFGLACPYVCTYVTSILGSHPLFPSQRVGFAFSK